MRQTSAVKGMKCTAYVCVCVCVVYVLHMYKSRKYLLDACCSKKLKISYPVPSEKSENYVTALLQGNVCVQIAGEICLEHA